jgi:hypothetical protein
MNSADPLLAQADRLYSLPPGEFTPARDAAAKEAPDRDFGKRIKTLRKPTVAAWALNLLVRRESDQIGQVLSLGAALREAAEAMAGDELRALTRQRRQLTAALATTARALAREYDVRLTTAVADQVEAMLNAAMLDPVAADVVRTGLVVSAFTSTGVGELDLGAVLAIPSAVGVRAQPLQAPALRLVPDDDKVRRARLKDALEKAVSTLGHTEESLRRAEAALADADAERHRIGSELAEARLRVRDLEAEEKKAASEYQRLTGERATASSRAAAARTAVAEAQEALTVL